MAEEKSAPKTATQKARERSVPEGEAATVTQTPEESPGGFEGKTVKPAADMSKDELKDAMTFSEDRDLHPSENQLAASDKTSIPGPEYPPIHRPPVSSTRPDEPIVTALVLGAGAHTPPDPEVFDAEGRMRWDAR